MTLIYGIRYFTPKKRKERQQRRGGDFSGKPRHPPYLTSPSPAAPLKPQYPNTCSNPANKERSQWWSTDDATAGEPKLVVSCSILNYEDRVLF